MTMNSREIMATDALVAEAAVSQHAVHIGGLEGAGHDGGESGHHQHQGQVGKRSGTASWHGRRCSGRPPRRWTGPCGGWKRTGHRQSWTAPKKMPPISTHSTTGIQPNTAAWMGPLIGAGAGDRRKVVAHQHRSLGGDIVHAVLQLMGRGGPGVIHAPAPRLASHPP